MNFFQINLRITFLLISSLFFGCNQKINHIQPLAREGVLDLTNVNFEEIENMNLDGDWDFYWKEFYTYEEILSKKISPDLYFKVPGVWNGTRIKDEILTGIGFSTLHLLVKVSKEQTNLGIRIPIIETAHKIWINEKLIYSAGEIAKSDAMVPYILRAIKPIALTEQNEFHITIQISNFMNRTGGVPGVFLIGKLEKLYEKKNIDITIDMIIFGSLFIMGVYHLGLFIIRRKDKSALFFGLFCLDFGLRLLLTDERVLLTSFPSLPFNLTYRLEFFTAFTMFFLFVAFLYHLFPNKIHHYFYRGIGFFTLLLSGCVLVLHHTIYTQLQVVYEFLLLVSIPYLIYSNYTALKNKDDGSFVSIIGVALLAFGALIDILQTEHILYGHYVFPFALFGFLFFQSFSIALKFSKAFFISEKLTDELVDQKYSLEKTNKELYELQKNLEQKVKEKGEELEIIYQKNMNEVQKINSLEKELAIQRERQKILTDIHDHMGSNIMDLGRVFTKINTEGSIPVEDLENAKLSLQKLEDNLRLKLYSIEDLEIFKKDPINGIRLIILRRYSIYNREINIFCDMDSFDLSLGGLDRVLAEGMFSIAQETANNDLKYGYGLSKWNFFLENNKLNLEIVANSNYKKENESIGNGKKNIPIRLKELNADAKHYEEEGIFHVKYTFPLEKYSP
ncbi:MAG: hypothetical protein KDK54_16550 [Leptospiraceae bacterium]|nr:hypothetical protein [Leptospiraceae bacterium]